MEKDYFFEISRLFISTIETIDKVLNNKFYTDTQSLIQTKIVLKKWYRKFNKTNSMVTISVKDLETLSLEISDFFSKYIETEPISHNYTKILSFNINNLKLYWKIEMEKNSA